jgi:hypothetical protein
VPEELLGKPAYTGQTMYEDREGGYQLWLPSDWKQIKLKRKHQGMLFSPYQDDINTCFLVEKKTLKIKVTPEDMPVLREGLREGILALTGAEIESMDEALSESFNVFDARFTFLEGEARRKRWVRNIYWGEGQLILIAQGHSPEDYDYWLPMFYNTMTTARLV